MNIRNTPLTLLEAIQGFQPAASAVQTATAAYTAAIIRCMSGNASDMVAGDTPISDAEELVNFTVNCVGKLIDDKGQAFTPSKKSHLRYGNGDVASFGVLLKALDDAVYLLDNGGINSPYWRSVAGGVPLVTAVRQCKADKAKAAADKARKAKTEQEAAAAAEVALQAERERESSEREAARWAALSPDEQAAESAAQLAAHREEGRATAVMNIGERLNGLAALLSHYPEALADERVAGAIAAFNAAYRLAVKANKAAEKVSEAA